MPTVQWLCIEFVKTVGWQARDRDDDELETFGGFVAWLERNGLLVGQAVEEVSLQAGRRPDEAAAALADAVRARDLIYSILTRAALAERLDVHQVEELNRRLQDAMRLRRLAADGGRFEWVWGVGTHRLSDLAAPVVWSMAELLTSPELERLRLCDAHDCGWLFIDASRNRSRRWCDMADCGNLAKVRRFRQRKKTGR